MIKPIENKGKQLGEYFMSQTRAGRILENLNKRRKFQESPMKIDQEMIVFSTFGSMSKRALDTRYQYLGNLGKYNEDLKDVEVYYSSKHKHFRSGIFKESSFETGVEDLSILTQIDENETRLVDVTKIPQLRNPFQIGLVQTKNSSTGKGIAKAMYIFLTRIGYDIVSDCEQFLGGYWLWKSLVKSDKINVYVWDDIKKDYLRDDNGKILRYDGNNIPEDEIWSTDESKLHTVLVSTSKTLK